VSINYQDYIVATDNGTGVACDTEGTGNATVGTNVPIDAWGAAMRFVQTKLEKALYVKYSDAATGGILGTKCNGAYVKWGNSSVSTKTVTVKVKSFGDFCMYEDDDPT